MKESFGECVKRVSESNHGALDPYKVCSKEIYRGVRDAGKEIVDNGADVLKRASHDAIRASRSIARQASREARRGVKGAGNAVRKMSRNDRRGKNG